jgi:hypothetical protein
MSSRALRKAQREREEQERLKRLEEDENVQDEEDVFVAQTPKKSAFTMLYEADDEEDDNEEDREGAEADQPAQRDTPATQSIPKPATKKKKKKKKAKSAANTPDHPVTSEAELDEIDQALKQLSTNGDPSLPASTAAGINHETEEASKLLSIDTTHLHAQNEMRRLFGRTAIEQQEDDDAPNEANVGGNRRQQRRIQQMGLAQALRGNQQGGRPGGLTPMALKRNIFIQGKEEWPNATSGGLGMEVEEKRADGTILYRFVHNTVYQDTQRQFSIAVESMDPNRLILLLQQNPYHIATLLQVSEIAKQDRNHAVAGDLLERALFSFGRAVHSTFAKTLAEGKARLDFRRPQNREFWLASWRYVQNLSMRATWRTVYEWAKLLLQLNPENDPYAMWLVLDQYALRSRQDLDYLNLSRNPTFKDRLETLPNVHLSQGLAEVRAGNKSKGQQALFKAIGKYPWVVARLMQELNLDPPPAIWGKEPRTESERLHSELYATRAKDLWGTPECSSLLMETASAIPPDTQPAPLPSNDEITESVARHVLLSDTPALIALLPRSFTARVQSSSDPLPPADSYDMPAAQSWAVDEDLESDLAILQETLNHDLPAGSSGLPRDDLLQMLQSIGMSRSELRRRARGLAESRASQQPSADAQNPRNVPGGWSEDSEEEGQGMRARVEDAEDSDD